MKRKMTREEFTERHAYEIESMLLGRDLGREMEEADLFRLRQIWAYALNNNEVETRAEKHRRFYECDYYVTSIARVMSAHKPNADRILRNWIFYEAWECGVEPMLDAYCEGVPMEDILA